MKKSPGGKGNQPFANLEKFLASTAGTSPAAKLHQIRRKVAESCSRLDDEWSMEIFCRYARKLRDGFMNYADSQMTFNPVDKIGLCAYRIAFETALGHHVIQEYWEGNYIEQITAWNKVIAHAASRSTKPALKGDLVFNRTEEGKEVQNCLDKINTFGARNVSVRRDRWDYLKANKWLEKSPERISVVPECYADHLLELEDRNKLSTEQVMHELNIYIASSYATICNTLAWILHLLATHPEIQEKCYQEMIQVLEEERDKAESRPGSSASMKKKPPPRQPASPSSDTLATSFSLYFATSDLRLTMSQLDHMDYLEWIIREAFRIYPAQSASALHGKHKSDPAAQDSFIFNRSKNYLTSNKKEERNGNSERSPLLGKKSGSRIFPGVTFAVQELKVILTHLLLAFRWESGEIGTEGQEVNAVKGGWEEVIMRNKIGHGREPYVKQDDKSCEGNGAGAEKLTVLGPADSVLGLKVSKR